MIYASLFILFISHLAPWITPVKTPLGNNPSKLISIMSGAMTLPYFIALIDNPSNSPIYNLVTPQEFHRLLTKFSLLYSLSISLIHAGVYLGSKVSIFKKNIEIITSKNLAHYKRLSYIFFSIATLFILIKISTVGGIFYLIENINIRGEVLSGTAYLDLIITPSTYLCAFFGIYANSRYGSPKTRNLILMIAIMGILLAAFGGRKSTMMLIILSITVSSIYNNRINLISLKNLVVYAIIAIFFMSALQFRIDSQLGGNSYEITLIETIKNFSYIDIYLLILKHFESNNYWYGVGFLDLVHRAIPIYSNYIYPPIDDGLYIRTILEGIYVKPPMSVNELYPSSWPPETFGSGYLNFGIFGIVIFSLLKGIISGLTLNFARINNFSPIPLFILIYTALNFHISNLRIAQIMILAVGLIIITITINITKIKVKRN